ncbi:ADP-ribose pyrophosphatase [soil metagenome]
MNTLPPTPILESTETITLGKKYDYLRMHLRTPKGKAQSREMVRHPGAVVIVPVLPNGDVVLIRIFRVAIQQWVWECCAGTIERPRNADGSFGRGEDPAVCAARELLEETGYRPGTLKPLAEFYTTPGLTDERMHAFLAMDLELLEPRREEDEYIVVEVMPAQRALSMLDAGEINDGKTMTALLLALRAGALRE